MSSLSTFFPYSSEIDISSDLRVHYDLVIDTLGPMLTPERKNKIQKIAEMRNFSTAVVLEGIYDRGNISAVMRSAEGLGFANFHVIETQEKFKEANRVTQGADKWVETKKWKKSKDCIDFLKSKGYKICVTTLEGAKPMHEVDFSVPTALVLGNEKDGVTPEMSASADERIIIPMSGFVQSFNISVAGALCLYHISEDRRRRLGKNADLTQEQIGILKALYYLRTQESGYDVLKDKFSKTMKA